MSVTWKLRGAFALYVALLAAVLLYHVRTVRQSVVRGHALTATAARMRAISSEQTGRVTEMSSTAEKYLVTRDQGYLDKLAGLVQSYSVELRRLASLPLSDEERARLQSLTPLWRDVEQNTAVFAGADAASAPPAAIVQAVNRVQQLLDEIHTRTLHVGEAARSAMTRQLAESSVAARNAERLSWLAALGALLLGAVLSALLVRSIVRPLDRLARGTREISAGRFGYRLEASGRDEFSQVAYEFNAMTARLDELEGLKREFVSNVSHDLKTPLSSMRETTEVLLDGLPGPLNEKQRRLLQLNQEGGQRLAAMIAKLLDLSRLESAVPRVETVDLSSIVRGVVERTAAAGRERAASVHLSEPDRQLFVRADPDGIAQVLDNLLENAIKFSPPNGPVRVSLAVRGEQVVLSVADEGPGIPDADKERVFERFYQTKVGRALPARGVGLGLAICRHIIVAHGGTIRVTDNTPRGSVFTVRLPLLREERGERREERGERRGKKEEARKVPAPLSSLLSPLFLLALGVSVLSSGACASARRDHQLAERELLKARIASLVSENERLSAARDSMGVQSDSLRRSAARLEADLRERDELIRALKLELERLKEIDLRPRPKRPPLSTDP